MIIFQRLSQTEGNYDQENFNYFNCINVIEYKNHQTSKLVLVKNDIPKRTNQANIDHASCRQRIDCCPNLTMSNL